MAEVELNKRGIQIEGNLLVEKRLGHDFLELQETDGASAVGVEQLEDGPVEGVWFTQPSLQRQKLVEWDSVVFIGVDHAREKREGVGIVVFCRQEL